MIVAGKPEEGLLTHQFEAYMNVIKDIEENGKAAVVMPTGCGKSFVALQMIEENKDKDMLFVVPQTAIRNQMYQYIAKYIVGEEPSAKRSAKKIAEEKFPGFKVITYQGLKGLNQRQMKQAINAREKINPDLIILDELHRAGAEKWSKEVESLLDRCPQAKLLGLTATPERTDGKDMIDELFEGKKAYGLTLTDAFARGILKEPKYIVSKRAVKQWASEQVESMTNQKLKLECQQILENLEEDEEIQKIFEEHIEKKNGKYIIFCKDSIHMQEMMEKSKEWFKGIDDNPEIYSVYSGENDKKKNEKQIEDFKDSKTDNLKLLFSIDMLNEGLHVGDVSGVVFLRPTKSKTMFLQQLGRTLSADKGEGIPLVFDLVNNITQYLEVAEEINSRRIELGIDSVNKSNEKQFGIENIAREGAIADLAELLKQDKIEKEHKKTVKQNWKEAVTDVKEMVEGFRSQYSGIKELSDEMKQEQKDIQEKIDSLKKQCSTDKELGEVEQISKSLKNAATIGSKKDLFAKLGIKKMVNKRTEKPDIQIIEEEAEQKTELEQKKDELQKQKNIEIKIGEMEKLIDIQRSNDDQGRAEV